MNRSKGNRVRVHRSRTHAVTQKRVGEKFLFAGILSLFSVAISFGVADAANSIISTTKGVQFLFCDIITWMIWFLLAISVIMVIVAAFQYVTAGNNAEQATKGRHTLTYAVIGIAIVLVATGVPALVANFLGGNASAFSCSPYGGPSGTTSSAPSGSSGASTGNSGSGSSNGGSGSLPPLYNL